MFDIFAKVVVVVICINEVEEAYDVMNSIFIVIFYQYSFHFLIPILDIRRKIVHPPKYVHRKEHNTTKQEETHESPS